MPADALSAQVVNLTIGVQYATSMGMGHTFAGKQTTILATVPASMETAIIMVGEEQVEMVKAGMTVQIITMLITTTTPKKSIKIKKGKAITIIRNNANIFCLR